jgi:DNA polymerase I-like protein with 3'-5' exonuclease and polymerase domains
MRGQEKAMLKAYENGLDLHAVTGAQLGGVPYDEFLAWKDAEDAKLAKLFEDLRQQAKAGNFGLLWHGCRGLPGLCVGELWPQAVVCRSRENRDDFFALYSGLTSYHDRQREMVRIKEMVRSPLGRIRHLPMIRTWDREVKSRAERQAINSRSSPRSPT